MNCLFEPYADSVTMPAHIKALAPTVAADLKELAERIGVVMPDMVIEDGTWNASIFVNPEFSATGRPILVPLINLGTLLLEKLTRDEVRAVLAHELGHLKRGDVVMSPLEKTFYILPAPFSWIYAFFKRRTELACDDFAAKYVGPLIAASALDKLRIEATCECGMCGEYSSLGAFHPTISYRVARLRDPGYEIVA